jgi:histidinol-phosphate aminotransferase
VLTLHRNENLFVGTDWTLETAREVVARSGISVYPDPACQQLRQALAERYGVSPAQIFVGNGSDEVLADLLALLRLRYDMLHILDVGFKVYPLLAERLGYRLEVLPERTFVTGRVRAPGFGGLALVDSPIRSSSGTTFTANTQATNCLSHCRETSCSCAVFQNTMRWPDCA